MGKKLLAKLICEDHPGIDNEEVAAEVVDACMVAIRKHLLREGEVHLDGVGRLHVRKISGTDEKRDARTGIVHKISDRQVVKFVMSDNFKKILNVNRKPTEIVSRERASE